MSDYIARYGVYLREEKHASENTISSYLRDVRQFESYLTAVAEQPLENCRQAHVESYLVYMQGKGKSAASVARGVASLKSFYQYLIAIGVLDVNPAKGVTSVRAERKYPEILTGKEVETFLEQPQCVDAKGYRDHAMLELLYATGIRFSELGARHPEDRTFSPEVLRGTSRGRERCIPLCAGR